MIGVARVESPPARRREHDARRGRRASSSGYAPLPRLNGELVFDEVWHGRALGMGVVVLERLGRPGATSAITSSRRSSATANPRASPPPRPTTSRSSTRSSRWWRHSRELRRARVTCEHGAMLGVLLALSASLMWGFADYLGGLQTRSRQVLVGRAGLAGRGLRRDRGGRRGARRRLAGRRGDAPGRRRGRDGRVLHRDLLPRAVVRPGLDRGAGARLERLHPGRLRPRAGRAAVGAAARGPRRPRSPA